MITILEDALEWISKEKKNPLPLRYQISSILNIFQQKYFEGIDVDFKSVKMQLGNYLQVLFQI